MRTRAGRLLSIPYPQEVNDIPSIVARKDGAEAFATMITDTFEEQFEQAEATGQALVMGIALHPYIVGQPHRLRRLRRALAMIAERREQIWLTHAGSIDRYCRGLPEGTISQCNRPPLRPRKLAIGTVFSLLSAGGDAGPFWGRLCGGPTVENSGNLAKIAALAAVDPPNVGGVPSIPG